MKKFFSFLLFAGLLFNFSNKAIAVESQPLYLKKGSSYILIFDEKIEKYRVSDNKSLKVELLTNIFNDKHEVLIKLLNENNSNISIQTKTKTYNFDILTSKDPNNANFTGLNIIVDEPPKINKPQTKDTLENLDIDAPPMLKSEK